MKIINSKRRRIVLSVSVLCLLFLALIWVSYFRQISFDRQDAIQFAIERNSNLAVALEQYAISTLHNADAVLHLVRIEYAQQGDALNLEKLLAKNILTGNGIAGVFLINSRGALVMSGMNHSADPSTDFSNRTDFIFYSKYDVDSLFINKPVISITGRPVIEISRRLIDSKGKFHGMVVLQLEPLRFTSFYAQAKLLPNDIISLISLDGITYARRTGTKESFGEDIHRSPLFSHVTQHADSFYFAPDAIKQIPSWFSYRKLKDYPIIATVGSSENDILAEYAVMRSRIKIPRIIASVVVVLLSVLIAIVLLLRQKASERLEGEKERYERLLTEQMIAVQEKEREWIGRELHDNVNQVLTAAKLYLEIASKQQNDPLIPRSMQLINSSIGEIRNLSHQLSAPTLGTRSLTDSINVLIEMMASSTRLLFSFHHSGCGDRLVMSQKLALYRILQEQLNNIIKHAAATKIWISVYEDEGNITLTVRDNGKGFDKEAETNGRGLNNMISRAKVLGGTIEIQTAPQKGCCLRVSVPMVMVPNEQCV